MSVHFSWNAAALDRLGVAASVACAIHCALAPLLVAALPFVGAGLLNDARLEWGLVGVSATLGGVALGWGYRTHRRRAPLAVLGLGLALLTLGRIAESAGSERFGIASVVVGGLGIALAHVLNHRCTCACHRELSVRL